MSAREKSDLPEVAEKRANKAALAAAEPVERRGGTKENAELQSTNLTRRAGHPENPELHRHQRNVIAPFVRAPFCATPIVNRSNLL
jgi:hypothetical protein